MERRGTDRFGVFFSRRLGDDARQVGAESVLDEVHSVKRNLKPQTLYAIPIPEILHPMLAPT